MKFRYLLILLFGTMLLLGRAENLYADNRSYVWTYEYQTLPKGKSEIEFYETMKVADTNDTDLKTFEHWLEYEYGVTDNFDFAIYQMWKTQDKRAEFDTKYDGTKLRVRYRFGRKGQYLVDPLAYLEYKRSAKSHDPHKLELKLILAKDIGNFNFAYNQILNQALESDGITESEYALGISYALNYHWRLGLESKGSFLKDQYYWGPTVSFRSAKFWVALGAALGMHKRADDLQTRLIVGIPF